MKKDINNQVFSPETKLKLDIFFRCFKEWLPVFMHSEYVDRLYILDFFAGSGAGIEGTQGSPLLMLKATCQNNGFYCKGGEGTKIYFFFSVLEKNKSVLLEERITSFLKKCKTERRCSVCRYSENISIKTRAFHDLFQDASLNRILQQKNYAKFILLDQYGFSKIDESVFDKLVHSPKTDFIFFISSSYIRRFKTLSAVQRYFDIEKINYDISKPKDCHRNIAQYYKNLLTNKDFFIHHFTIKNNANYYGLIFGTSHSLGMEKFLRVCWEMDPASGESNCNIDNDYGKDSLFYDSDNTNKVIAIKNTIKNGILSGKIVDNKSGLLYTLHEGCKGSVFVDVDYELKKNRKISIIGKFNRQTVNIHKVDEYRLEVVDESKQDRMD